MGLATLKRFGEVAMTVKKQAIKIGKADNLA
jgi:hypothetical protein